MNDTQLIQLLTTSMEAQKLRPITISKRADLIRRLSFFLGEIGLLGATLDDLRRYQTTFSHLSSASVNIYTRHVRAFYRWAFEMDLIDANTATKLRIPRVPKGVPHPTTVSDLKVIFTCAPDHLRVAYVLAAFAGLRCGEIARLRTEHLTLDTPVPTAIIDGKGGKERIVPLLPPVANELRYRSRGWVITRPSGKPWPPNVLSASSGRFLDTLGIETTLHGMRHYFATTVARLTHDPLLVRDLLGHQSVSTTEIYMDTDMTDAHARLAGFTALAGTLVNPAA